MKKKTPVEQPRRPGRRPSLNADHTKVLRAITKEQPRSSLDEVSRELLRRAGVKVSTVTVRKALREAGIDRLKPLRRAGERAAVQGSLPTPYGHTAAHRRADVRHPGAGLHHAQRLGEGRLRHRQQPLRLRRHPQPEASRYSRRRRCPCPSARSQKRR